MQEKLAERGEGQAWLMRELLSLGFKVDRPRVSRWWNGHRLPEPKERAAIEDLLGVGWRLWDDPVDAASRESSTDLKASEAELDDTGTDDGEG